MTAGGCTSLGEIALLFLRLGSTAFGGPAVHIAMMEQEVVRRRDWLTRERFLDLLGATNLIPGPNSTELAIHIGWDRRRWAGLLVAGVCFIVPAMLATGVLGWVYVRYAQLPQAGWLLYGIKPVVLAVVVQAIAGLAPKAAKTLPLGLLGLAAATLAWLGIDELLVLAGAGIASLLGARPWAGRARAAGIPDLLGVAALAPLAGLSSASAATLPTLFWLFCKIGSVLFGSGYVLLAFLESDLVERLGWLTQQQLLDAVAIGQVTPGPVFTTATFIGYLLQGPAGALVATAGIFLPAFVFVAASGPLVPRLRASRAAGAFLDGVNVASLGLMAAVTLELLGASVVDVPSAALALASAAALLAWRVGSVWLVLGGAAAGWLLHAVG